MKKIFIILLILGLMEGVSWWVYRAFFSQDTPVDTQKITEQNLSQRVSESNQNRKIVTSSQKENSEEGGTIFEDIPPVTFSGDWDVASFPPPSTEVVNGVTERTIHIGVRQWAWDPNTITAKRGEVGRLIVHNADVKHGLVIPDLGVNQDIPEEGAVIAFTANEAGTFEFICSVYCGEGHMEMSGKIIIE